MLPEHFSRVTHRANDGLRSRDLDVGNVALYRLSYVRMLLREQTIRLGSALPLQRYLTVRSSRSGVDQPTYRALQALA